MNALETIKTQQLKKVTKALHHLLGIYSPLGKSYSLADYDYFDTNRNFPDQGIDWLNAGSSITIDELVANYGNEREIMYFQVKNKVIFDKQHHWDSVNPEYLQKYQYGFRYMDPTVFKFYLAAWIFQYCTYTEKKQSTSVLNDITRRFLDKFSGSFYMSENLWWKPLNRNEIHLIIDFIILIYMVDENEKQAAQNCLSSGWINYDNKYGKNILDAFISEKMVQDFIDKM